MSNPQACITPSLFYLFDWKWNKPKQNTSQIVVSKSIRGSLFFYIVCIVNKTSDLSSQPFSGTGLREGLIKGLFGHKEIDWKRAMPLTLMEKMVDAGSPEDNLHSLKGREWWWWAGDCTLWNTMRLPQGIMLLLLNSFNKHLTFTERKINTQEVTLFLELLLAIHGGEIDAAVVFRIVQTAYSDWSLYAIKIIASTVFIWLVAIDDLGVVGMFSQKVYLSFDLSKTQISKHSCLSFMLMPAYVPQCYAGFAIGHTECTLKVCSRYILYFMLISWLVL